MNTSIEPFLLINGIRTKPNKMFAWTDRVAREELFFNHGILSEKLEYNMGMFRSRRKLRRLSDNFAEVVRGYNKAGFIPNIIAHSNGNVVVCRALARHPDIRMGTFFMLMPACYSDMNDNHLNVALKQGQVTSVRFFGSKRDMVVLWGHRLTGFLKRFSLGYGGASFDGLLEIRPSIRHLVKSVDLTPWGHSEFHKPENLSKFLADHVIPYARERAP
jgi:hypothetical protein